MRIRLLALTCLLIGASAGTARADFWVPQPVDLGAAGSGSKVIPITAHGSGERVVIGTNGGRNLNLTRPGPDGLTFVRYKRHQAPAAINDVTVFSTLGDTVVIVLTLADSTYQVHHVRVSDGENLPGFPVVIKPASDHGSRSAAIVPDGQGYALGLATDQSLQVASIGRQGEVLSGPLIVAQGARFLRPVMARPPGTLVLAWEELRPDGSSRPGVAVRVGDVFAPVDAGETDRPVQGRPDLQLGPGETLYVTFSTWDLARGITAYRRPVDPATGALGVAERLTPSSGDCCFASVAAPGPAAYQYAAPLALVGATFDGSGFLPVLRAPDGALLPLGTAGPAFPHPAATAFGRGAAPEGVAVAWIAAKSGGGVQVAGGGYRRDRRASRRVFGRPTRNVDNLAIAGDGRGNGIATWTEDVGGRPRAAAAAFDADPPTPSVKQARGRKRTFFVACGKRERLGCKGRFAAFRKGARRPVREVSFPLGAQPRTVRLSDATMDALTGGNDDAVQAVPVRIELLTEDRAGNVGSATLVTTVLR